MRTAKNRVDVRSAHKGGNIKGGKSCLGRCDEREGDGEGREGGREGKFDISGECAP